MRLRKIEGIETMTADEYAAKVASGAIVVGVHTPNWKELRSVHTIGSFKWKQCADPVLKGAGAMPAALGAAQPAAGPTTIAQSMMAVAAAIGGLGGPQPQPQPQQQQQQQQQLQQGPPPQQQGPPDSGSGSDSDVGTPLEYHAVRGREGKSYAGCIMTYGRGDRFRAVGDGDAVRKKKYASARIVWIFVHCFEGTVTGQRGYMKQKWLREGVL